MADEPSSRRARALAKRDPIEWHGQRIVTETDLGAVFSGDDEEDPAPRLYTKRIIHGVVLLLLVGLLTSAVIVAVGINRGEIRIAALESSPEPTETCPQGPFEFQDPSAVTVNVYNSTDIEGLAGGAAEQLRKRAFVVAEIGNRSVSGNEAAAIIVSGADGAANAFTVQRTIPGSLYVSDDRADRTVDVVLGKAFKAVAAADAVDKKPAGLACLGAQTQEAVQEASPGATPDAP